MTKKHTIIVFNLIHQGLPGWLFSSVVIWLLYFAGAFIRFGTLGFIFRAFFTQEEVGFGSECLRLPRGNRSISDVLI
jgi:hypothetical protein